MGGERFVLRRTHGGVGRRRWLQSIHRRSAKRTAQGESPEKVGAALLVGVRERRDRLLLGETPSIGGCCSTSVSSHGGLSAGILLRQRRHAKTAFERKRGGRPFSRGLG